MYKTLFLLSLIISIGITEAQTNYKVLFLGNSYTAVNNLPQIVKDIANSTGDTLSFESSTPGGSTLQAHSTNPASLSLIGQGDYDYVVLQEQSQLPSFPLSQVQQSVFPYAQLLDSLINFYNPRAETVFYRTWGRKNGDASNCATWPPVCTYAGMDSLLALRYQMMADNNEAFVSPVGEVWKYIRQHHPSIELYDSDESHPSQAGSYAAGLSFYTTFFRKDPAQVSFNYTLTSLDADFIKQAVKAVVYDSLGKWNIGNWDPQAMFTAVYHSNYQLEFSNASLNSDTYFWDFGDGSTSGSVAPVHTFAGPYQYNVKLIAYKCQLADTLIIPVNPILVGQVENTLASVQIFPNPAREEILISGTEEHHSARLYNADGREMIQIEMISGKAVMDVRNLSRGIYFLMLRNSAGAYTTEKLILD